MAEQHRELHGDRVVLRAHAPRAAVEVDEVGRVVALVVRAERVAADHEVGRTLHRDAVPDRQTVAVQRDRDLLDGRAGAREPVGRVAHGLVDIGLGEAGQLEALAQHADAQALGPAVEAIDVRRDLHADLARVEPVLAGEDLEHERAVGDRPRHRPDVVDRQLDREDAGVGDEPVGRLVPAAPAPRRGQADRAALVAAERHVGLAGDDDHGAPVRRRPAEVRRVVRVRRLRVGVAGEAAAVEAERGHGGLADDLGAGVEQPRHDRRVLARDVALHDRRAVEHRDAGDADVVLDAHALAGERPLRRARDRALPAPAVGGVVRAGRPVAEVGARILHRQVLVGQLVEASEAGEGRRRRRRERLELLVREREVELRGEALQLLARGRLDRHGDLLRGGGRGRLRP